MLAVTVCCLPDAEIQVQIGVWSAPMPTLKLVLGPMPTLAIVCLRILVGANRTAEVTARVLEFHLSKNWTPDFVETEMIACTFCSLLRLHE